MLRELREEATAIAPASTEAGSDGGRVFSECLREAGTIMTVVDKNRSKRRDLII